MTASVVTCGNPITDFLRRRYPDKSAQELRELMKLRRLEWGRQRASLPSLDTLQQLLQGEVKPVRSIWLDLLSSSQSERVRLMKEYQDWQRQEGFLAPAQWQVCDPETGSTRNLPAMSDEALDRLRQAVAAEQLCRRSIH
jgi:hypothetical protein